MAVKATQAEEKEFDLETWLREGNRGLRHILKCKPPVMPEEFKSHTRAARKEMLLALRSLLDTAIGEMEETAAPAKR
jgi:hypothetical protein